MTDSMFWLGGQSPIVLLPVRLETRFAGQSLKVRVYPDACHVDTHEPELTADERAAGARYWADVAGSADAGAASWRVLAGRFGPERAAWVARLTRTLPANSFYAQRAASWTRAPYARGLPDRWVVEARLGSLVVSTAGKPIPDPLVIGPDPAAAGKSPAWLTDFDAAVAVGMGVVLTLPASMAVAGIDRLLVYGVRQELPERSSRRLRDLFDGHAYTRGFSYLPAGTPTNNTDEVSSGYDPRSAEHIAALAVPGTDPVPPADSNAGRLSRALGLPLTEQQGQSFFGWVPGQRLGYDSHIAKIAYFNWVNRHGGTDGQAAEADWLAAEHLLLAGQATSLAVAPGAADSTDEHAAAAMQSALWAGTIGYYLSQLLVPGSGEDARRLDHHNVVETDAYLLSLDRSRAAQADWAAACLAVYTNWLASANPNMSPSWAQSTAAQALAGHDPGAWEAVINQRASVVKQQRLGYWLPGMTPDPQDYATVGDTLMQAITSQAYQLWQARSAGLPQTPMQDWLTAQKNLRADRIARYAYFRYLSRGAPYSSDAQRLEDWLDAETAASYSTLTADGIRNHYVHYVRPNGPLPAIRIANQPYGVLPVLAADRWQPRTGEQSWRAGVKALRALRDQVWLPSAQANVPRLTAGGQQTVPAAQATLLSLLATAPTAQAVFAREQIGREYLGNLWRFARLNLHDSWPDTLRAVSATILDAAGVSWQPRVSGMVSSPDSHQTTTPLIDGTPANWLGFLSATGTGWKQLLAAVTPPNGEPTSLLYQLLRHSALRERADAAIRVQLAASRLGDFEHFDPELIDLDLTGPTPTVIRQLDRQINVNGTSWKLADYLENAASSNDPAVAPLRQQRAATAQLAGLDPDTLQRAFIQTLDSGATRLDAWLTSLATRRLENLRSAGTVTSYLGGYGFVENLRPRGTAQLSAGYVHAPSLPQAVTSAVLRSGYLSMAGGSTNPFAINLDSRRVRLAEYLLGAVRQGQSLASVGGYLFERALHEGGQDALIAPFRALAPVTATAVAPDAAPQEVVAATDVTDGLALRRLWRAGDGRVTAILQTLNDVDQPKVLAALGSLDEALDAVSDLLIAESVHHAAAGNPTKAAATLDAVAGGNAPLPQPTFPRTPRSAVPITNRVLLFDDDDVVYRWSPNRPRWTLGAPERLIAALLPAPGSVRAAVSFGATTVTVRASDCVLGAADVVYEADPAAAVPSDFVTAAVIAAGRYLAGDATGPAVVHWQRAADWSPGELTFPELAAAAGTVRRMLRRSRAAGQLDLELPAGLAPSAFDTALAARVDNLAKAFSAAGADFARAAKASDPVVAPDSIRLAADLGVLGAARLLIEPGPELLAAVAGELGRRLTDLAAAQAAPASDARTIACARAMAGSEFLCLPSFSPVDGGWHSVTVGSGRADPAALRSWLAQAARVRGTMTVLDQVRIQCAALGLTTADSPYAVQRPSGAEAWVGGPTGSIRPSGPRLHLVLPLGRPPTSMPLRALVVDEWNEALPSTTEVTGLAFHVDTPGSAAPQSILIAVPPDPNATGWDSATLSATLHEALDLAKIRTVDMDALAALGQLLPALYVANNTAGDTISTDVLAPPAGS